MLGHKATGRAGGPAVLIVEPGQHFLGLRLVTAGFHHIHKFIAEVRRVQTGAGVEMGAAEAHFFHLLQLAQELLLFQLAVPGPEGRSPILRGRILEQFLRQRRCGIFLVQHEKPSLFLFCLHYIYAYAENQLSFPVPSTFSALPYSIAARKLTGIQSNEYGTQICPRN